MATTKRASTDTLTDEERDDLRAGCEHRLQGHGVRNIAAMLEELTALPVDDLEADVYGAGGAVAVLEQEVRELLGKPASVFMPSGTMAQQIALRIHADRRGRQAPGAARGARHRAPAARDRRPAAVLG